MKFIFIVVSIIVLVFGALWYANYQDELAHPASEGWTQVQDGTQMYWQTIMVGKSFTMVPQWVPKYKWVKKK